MKTFDEMSDNSRKDQSDWKTIEREASEWIVRQDLGFTARDQDQFHQWLARDPRHRKCYKNLQCAWDSFDKMAQWKPEHSEEVNPHLLEYLKPSKRYRAYLAVAACIAFFLLALVFFLPSQEKDSGVLEIASQSYQYYFFEDGSEVDLKAGTQLRVTFTEEMRKVELLSGEAYFTVAKDAARPFIVEVEGISVEAVGTEFNVRLNTKDSVEVLITEGRVNIDSRKHRLSGNEASEAFVGIQELISGQRTRVSLNSREPAMKVEDISTELVEEYLQWKPKKLQFSATPLSEVLEQFNEYNSVQLTLADSSLADEPISGSFRTVNISGFIRLLELSGNVRTHRKSDLEILLEQNGGGIERESH